MKPMLAKDAIPEKLRFPLIVQAKLDGIRACVVNGKLVTRTLKEVQNREIFEALSRPEYEGLDGEIVVGDPTAPGCFGRTSSFVMTRDKTGEDWTYCVFDKWDSDKPYNLRHNQIRQSMLKHKQIQIVNDILVSDANILEKIESRYIAQGYEGVILRDPNGTYKFGRSYPTDGKLLKLKRFKDGEAIIIDAYERLHNANEATTNALGRTERSSHKANKTGRGDLGGFEVEEYIDGSRTGRVFKIGTGFNDEQRKDYWQIRGGLVGKIVKYKHFEVGSKDLPRFPVFLGFRDLQDL